MNHRTSIAILIKKSDNLFSTRQLLFTVYCLLFTVYLFSLELKLRFEPATPWQS